MNVEVVLNFCIFEVEVFFLFMEDVVNLYMKIINEINIVEKVVCSVYDLNLCRSDLLENVVLLFVRESFKR